MLHARDQRDRHDLQAVPGHEEREQAPADAEVLDDHRVFGQRPADLREGKAHRGEHLQRLALRGGQLAQHAQELALVCAHLALQPLDALGGALLGRHLLGLDAVVVPVQLFAQIAHPPDQLALAGDVGDDGRGRPEQQLLEAAGLRLLHVGERVRDPALVAAAGQREVDEPLVDLELVLHERDLQLLAAEAAAQRLEERLGLLVGLEGACRPSRRLLDLALHVMELEAERGKVERRRALPRPSSHSGAGRVEVVHAQGEAGEQQPAEDGLAGQRGRTEGLRGRPRSDGATRTGGRRRRGSAPGRDRAAPARPSSARRRRGRGPRRTARGRAAPCPAGRARWPDSRGPSPPRSRSAAFGTRPWPAPPSRRRRR